MCSLHRPGYLNWTGAPWQAPSPLLASARSGHSFLALSVPNPLRTKILGFRFEGLGQVASTHTCALMLVGAKSPAYQNSPRLSPFASASVGLFCSLIGLLIGLFRHVCDSIRLVSAPLLAFRVWTERQQLFAELRDSHGLERCHHHQPSLGRGQDTQRARGIHHPPVRESSDPVARSCVVGEGRHNSSSGSRARVSELLTLYTARRGAALAHTRTLHCHGSSFFASLLASKRSRSLQI